jgi:hypothetical protein
MARFDWIGTSFKKGKVDLLFEEAAVNDVSIGRNGRPIGSWHGRHCRRARQANPDMDIVMMHFACTDKLEDYENGKTPRGDSEFRQGRRALWCPYA